MGHGLSRSRPGKPIATLASRLWPRKSRARIVFERAGAIICFVVPGHAFLAGLFCRLFPAFACPAVHTHISLRRLSRLALALLLALS